MPPKGGDGEDWLDARPIRRKAVRWEERGQDRWREDWRRRDQIDFEDQQLRFRDSREGPGEFENQFVSPGGYRSRYTAVQLEFCDAGKARRGGGAHGSSVRSEPEL